MIVVLLRKEGGGSQKKMDWKKYWSFKILQKIDDIAYVLDLPDDLKTPKTFNVADFYEYVSDNEEYPYPALRLKVKLFLSEMESCKSIGRENFKPIRK